MIRTETQGVHLYRFEGLSAFDGLNHFISGRKGGTSRGAFSSLNLGFHTGDNDFDVLQNRRILADAAGTDFFCATLARQCHSGNVAIVDESMKGRGAAELESALPNTDGMITNVPGICLHVLVADCVPIILYDPVKRVVAALHAGWRGGLKKIAAHAVEKMVQHYGCRAADMRAGLGPSNGPCCYEVGEDVRRETLRTLGNTKGIMTESDTAGKYFFDQWTLNKQQLLDYGLKDEHIETADICTQCTSDDFFSSRAGGGVTGRFAAGVAIVR